MLHPTDLLLDAVDSEDRSLNRARNLVSEERYEDALIELNKVTMRQAELTTMIYDRMKNDRQLAAARAAYELEEA